MQASCVLSPQARKLSLPETCSKPRARLVETDARTHMLLAKPIAPTTEFITFRGIIMWDFSPVRRQNSRSKVASGGRFDERPVVFFVDAHAKTARALFVPDR